MGPSTTNKFTQKQRKSVGNNIKISIDIKGEIITPVSTIYVFKYSDSTIMTLQLFRVQRKHRVKSYGSRTSELSRVKTLQPTDRLLRI